MKEIDIDLLAQMSKLHLTVQEKESYKKDLTEILEFLKVLDSEETKDYISISPTVMRSDIPCEAFENQPEANRKELLSNSQFEDDEYIAIPNK